MQRFSIGSTRKVLNHAELADRLPVKLFSEAELILPIVSIVKPALRSCLITLSAAAGIIGPILFGVLVIALGYLWTGYNLLTQTISELGATNAPYMGIHALNFAILGILTTIFVIGLNIHNGFFRSTAIVVGMYGLGSLLVAFLPCDRLLVPWQFGRASCA